MSETNYQMLFTQKPNGFDPNKILLIEKKKDEDKGLRFNDGKLRYDLLEPYALEQLVKVFTLGANKYAERNWEKGMKWTKMLASLKRHIAAFEKGEDFDLETGLPHMAHASWNAMCLVSYMKLYPKGDDRNHSYLSPLKIGLDIDGVLADFTGYLMKVSGNEGYKAEHWNDPIIRREFEKVKKDPEFWANIPPLMSGKEVPFEVHCYITARSIDQSVTQEWLDKNHFPSAPIYCVGVGESKIEVAKKAGMDVFIDDNYNNFVELTNAGIFTYLYSAPYNLKYDVGHRRLNSLKELLNK